jgi:hypothetical protein
MNELIAGMLDPGTHGQRAALRDADLTKGSRR